MSQPNQFRREIMPIIVVNSIFCTGLLEYFTSRSTHVIGFVYAIFVAISYCLILFSLVHIIRETWQNKLTNFALLVMTLQLAYNVAAYLWMVFGGIVRRKLVRLSMKHLENCVRTMDHKLGIPKSYSALFTYKYLVALWFCFMIISPLVVQIMTYQENVKDYLILSLTVITNIIPVVEAFVTEFSFVYWIRYTKVKLGQLNTMLQNMLTSTVESPQHRKVLRVGNKQDDSSPSSSIYRKCKTNEDVEKLKRIQEVHLELIKFTRKMNDAFGLHILMMMTTSFLLITTISYNLYVLMQKNNFTWKLEAFLLIYWIFFIGFKVVAINHMCATTALEVTEFAQQVIQNPVTFTACGFLDLNHALITGMFCTVTTYLVILVQVGQATPDEPENVIENSTSTF